MTIRDLKTSFRARRSCSSDWTNDREAKAC